MDIISYYKLAKKQGLEPTLLQFAHPEKKTPLEICAINPLETFAVRDNILYKNDLKIGHALDIFEHVKPINSPHFFPAFLGFFAYEYAHYFGFHTKVNTNFPDAFFRLYQQGLVIDDGVIIHHDPLAVSLTDDVLEKSHFSSLNASFSPKIDQDQFYDIVETIKNRIKDGDVYQVNFSLPFSFDVENDALMLLYEAMRKNNKSPYMGLIATDDFAVISGSPERLFSLKNNKITTRPIAGTKKRGVDTIQDNEQKDALIACPKENAEHVMLVDLLRNDLNQIADTGSVVITEDRSVEFYSHVMHLVSEVSGTTHRNLKDIMQAIFPGGTITGAPKQSVMKTIAELELDARGPYTGSLGYISSGYGVDFNILIRSVLVHKNKAWINAGAGIVIDSIPEHEWSEIHAKAQAVKDILLNKSTPCAPLPLMQGHTRAPIALTREHEDKRVLFIENHDSFSHNIIEALRSMGAEVSIHTFHDPALSSIDANLFTHLVIGPGPGNPVAMPGLSRMVAEGYHKKIPILGICLGHQAIGYYFGAAIKKAVTPVHGQNQLIHHHGQGLFNSLKTPSPFTRYHSLVIDQAPQDFVVDAYSFDDCIMAIRHVRLPIFGLQFHPESYLSSHGANLLHQFLRAQYDQGHHQQLISNDPRPTMV